MLNRPERAAAIVRLERAWNGFQELAELRAPVAICGALVVYALAFIALEPGFGAATATLGLPLAAVIGALLGVRLGVAIALAIFALSLFLLAATGYTTGDLVILLGSGVGAVLLVGVAAGFGRMRDL